MPAFQISWFLPNFLAALVGGYLIIYIITKLIQFYFRHQEMVAVFDKLPGDREKHWLWGQLHLFPGPNEEGLKFQRERVKKYPILSRFWISFIRVAIICNHAVSAKILLKTFPGPNEEGLRFWKSEIERFPLLHRVWKGCFDAFIVLSHPDSARDVLKSTEPKPTAVGTVYMMGVDWLGKGLLIANGQRWARNRRLLTPAFHFDILKPYTNVFNDVTGILLKKISDCSDKGVSFELFNYVGLASLDNILRCAFSYETNCQILGDSHPYVVAVHELCDLWVERSLNILHYPDFIFYCTSKGRLFKKHCDFVHKVAEDIIKKRQKTLEEEGLPTNKEGKRSRYLDFLDILLTAKDDDGKGLTLLEMRNEVDTFLFEGHDTTTSAMAWTLYSLAEHQEYQQKVQEEIDNLLTGRETDDLEWNDLSKLDYLTMCIKEGLRLHSPVSFIQREITKPYNLAGFHIPKGTSVAVQIYNIHHNEQIWENPMEFIPDRFLPENVAKRDSYAFVPFSAGPRNCIGQHFAMNEMKITIARILKRFTLTLDPDHKVAKKISVVMRAENGIKVFAKPREYN